MPTAVMIGAGKIGRGFIAEAMRASGYRVVFIDRDEALVNSLREFARYPVRVVGEGGVATRWVDGFTALCISQREEVARAVDGASLLAVSVGADNLQGVAEYLADALLRRRNAEPLNILCCENMIGADVRLGDAVRALWGEKETRENRDKVGFVPVCVGKTAPNPPRRLLDEHPLYLIVDAYAELPADARKLIGSVPLRGLAPYDPFLYCIQRKLFIHNLGHAVAAYLGTLRGHALLERAVEDRRVREVTRCAMLESARALGAAYPFAEGLEAYIGGLLALFADADMGDTLSRIGADPLRKTARDDRLAGAYRFCVEHGVQAPCIAAGLAAALFFGEEEGARSIRAAVRERGVENFLREHCGIDGAEATAVLSAYQVIRFALMR